MDKRKRLENFMTKAKLLGEDFFTVDLDNLALVKCEPGEYHKLVLPPVESISNHSLSDIKVQELVIPETVVRICPMGLEHCFIDNLTILGNIEPDDNAEDFYCLWARTVNVGKDFNYLGFFYGQGPDDITHVEAINISEDNPWFASDNGIVYNKDFSELLLYPQAHQQQVYIMPNTVKGTLGTYSLCEIDNLEKLKLSDNITELEERSIASCNKLEEIELGKHLKILNFAALYDLNSLQTVKVNNNLKEIANIKTISPTDLFELNFS